MEGEEAIRWRERRVHGICRDGGPALQVNWRRRIGMSGMMLNVMARRERRDGVGRYFTHIRVEQGRVRMDIAVFIREGEARVRRAGVIKTVVR